MKRFRINNRSSLLL